MEASKARAGLEIDTHNEARNACQGNMRMNEYAATCCFV